MARGRIAAADLGDRIEVAPVDVMTEPLPARDVVLVANLVRRTGDLRATRG